MRKISNSIVVLLLAALCVACEPSETGLISVILKNKSPSTTLQSVYLTASGVSGPVAENVTPSEGTGEDFYPVGPATLVYVLDGETAERRQDIELGETCGNQWNYKDASAVEGSPDWTLECLYAVD